jgi:hypothetical protein
MEIRRSNKMSVKRKIMLIVGSVTCTNPPEGFEYFRLSLEEIPHFLAKDRTQLKQIWNRRLFDTLEVLKSNLDVLDEVQSEDYEIVVSYHADATNFVNQISAFFESLGLQIKIRQYANRIRSGTTHNPGAYLSESNMPISKESDVEAALKELRSSL